MATPDSEFNDAENAASASEPSLGNIEGLDEGATTEPSLGDSLNLDSLEEGSEILGDISLLEEAIAELETEAAQSTDAPMEVESEDAVELEGEHDALQGLLNEDDMQTIAEEQNSTPEANADSVPTLSDEVDLSNTVIAFNQEQQAAVGDQSIPVLDDVAESGFSMSYVDNSLEDITADDDSLSTGSMPGMSEFPDLDGSGLEQPLEVPMDSGAQSDSGFPDFNMDSDANAGYSEPKSDMSRAVEHRVSVGNNTSLSISIPYELHAQLSKKIDGLVIEAATSITNELHVQLSNRMEGLLNQAVESVLPNLMDQMATGLRNEVKEKVRAQLPNIINDVLSKTRLTEEID